MAEAARLKVRRYRDADRDAVWSLHNVALREAGAHAGNGPWDDDLQSIPEVYLNAGGEFFIAELDGEIVAMGALRPSRPGLAELKRMRVHPAFQRRGFGELMRARLEARARELGFRTLHLDTTVAQTAAQHLYRPHGFVETGRGRLGEFELILFEKRLDDNRDG
jgi:ribosomal protein S18 acetylase RimI-like enzyme